MDQVNRCLRSTGWNVTGMLGVGVLALALTGCDKPEAKADTDAAPAATVSAKVEGQGADHKVVVTIPKASLEMLQIQTVGATPDAQTASVPAHVAFREDRISAVGAPVAARVLEINAHVGDTVRAGDVLATLTSTEALRIRYELATARSAHDVAVAEARRNQTMFDKGVGTEVEKLASDAHARETAQELNRAQRTAALLGGGSDDRIVLRAGRAGVISQASATVGASVEPDSALFMVGDPKSIWVVGEVFESDWIGLKEGATAQVFLPTGAEPITGRVVRVGAVLDKETRRAPVFIEVSQADAANLRTGMQARVALALKARESMLIPMTSVLIKDESRSIVFVQRAGTEFEARDVKLGAANRGFIPVLSGLQPGERIVVRGGLLLDGAASQLL